MPTTLADYSQLALHNKDYLKAGVIDTLRKESYLLDMMPFPNTGTLGAKGLRIKSLPTLQNRKVNDAYIHSVGAVEPIEEQGYLFGGKVQTDRVYKDASGGLIVKDYEAWQVELYLKALSYGWNDDMINNLPAAKPDSVVGLRYRLAQDFSGQIIDALAPDVSPDSAGLTAAFNTLFDAVQALIHKCDEHTCDVLLMNDTLKLRIESGLRQLGLWTTTKDSFGRTVATWGEGGPKIVDLGMKADQVTKIFPDTEGATGIVGGGAKTRIMALKFGEDYLTGWQLNPLQTYKWQQGVIHYTEIDWYAGLFITSPRSASWLYNIIAL